MRIIEVFYNNKEGLFALEFSSTKDGKRFLNNRLKGENVKLYLNRLVDNNLKGRHFVDNCFESIMYDDVCVRIYNYQFIRENGLLYDYYKKIDEYIRKKNSMLSSKVKRKNKYTGKKMLALGMAILMLVCASRVTINSGDSKKIDDDSDLVVSGMNVGVSNLEQLDGMLNFLTKESQINLNSNIDFLSTSGVSLGDKIQILDVEEEKVEDYIYIDYEDRSDYEKTKNTRKLYGEMILKYSRMYGLDSDLVIALATQERGIHSSEMDRGGATGLMQIQNAVWLNKSITAYNFETSKKETVHITRDMLSDCELNIKLGCMILQDCMKNNNYNILLALQSYNMGTSGARRAVSAYASDLNCSNYDIINNINDCGWLYYRNGIAGDSEYVEHVLSYIGSNIKICVYKPDGSKVECNVKNYQNVKTR